MKLGDGNVVTRGQRVMATAKHVFGEYDEGDIGQIVEIRLVCCFVLWEKNGKKTRAFPHKLVLKPSDNAVNQGELRAAMIPQKHGSDVVKFDEPRPLYPESCCWISGQEFSIMRGRHHCRLCGYAVCSEYLKAKLLLDPKYGYSDAVKVCNMCMTNPQRFDNYQRQWLPPVKGGGVSYMEFPILQTVLLCICVSYPPDIQKQDSGVSPVTISDDDNDIVDIKIQFTTPANVVLPTDIDSTLREFNVTIQRKWSDFQWLYNRLLDGVDPTLVPACPPMVKPFFKSPEKWVNERMEAANLFLSLLWNRPTFFNNAWLWCFLSLNSEQLRQLQACGKLVSVPTNEHTLEALKCLKNCFSVQHAVHLLLESAVIASQGVHSSAQLHNVKQCNVEIHRRQDVAKKRQSCFSKVHIDVSQRMERLPKRTQIYSEQISREKTRLATQQETELLVFTDREKDITDWKTMDTEREPDRAAANNLIDSLSVSQQSFNDDISFIDQNVIDFRNDMAGTTPPVHTWLLTTFPFVINEDAIQNSNWINAFSIDKEKLTQQLRSVRELGDVGLNELETERKNRIIENETQLPSVIPLQQAEQQMWNAEEKARTECESIREQERALRQSKEAAIDSDLTFREQGLFNRSSQQNARSLLMNRFRDDSVLRDNSKTIRDNEISNCANQIELLQQSSDMRTKKCHTRLTLRQQTSLVLLIPEAQVDAQQCAFDNQAAIKCVTSVTQHNIKLQADIQDIINAIAIISKSRKQLLQESRDCEEGNPRTKHESDVTESTIDTFLVTSWNRRCAIDNGLISEKKSLASQLSELDQICTSLQKQLDTLKKSEPYMAKVTTQHTYVQQVLDAEHNAVAQENDLKNQKITTIRGYVDAALFAVANRQTAVSELHQRLHNFLYTGFRQSGVAVLSIRDWMQHETDAIEDDLLPSIRQTLKETRMLNNSLTQRANKIRENPNTRLFFDDEKQNKTVTKFKKYLKRKNRHIQSLKEQNRLNKVLTNFSKWLTNACIAKLQMVTVEPIEQQNALTAWSRLQVDFNIAASSAKQFLDTKFFSDMQSSVGSITAQSDHAIMELEKVNEAYTLADQFLTKMNNVKSALANSLSEEAKLWNNFEKQTKKITENQAFITADLRKHEKSLDCALKDVESKIREASKQVTKAAAEIKKGKKSIALLMTLLKQEFEQYNKKNYKTGNMKDSNEQQQQQQSQRQQQQQQQQHHKQKVKRKVEITITGLNKFNKNHACISPQMQNVKQSLTTIQSKLPPMRKHAALDRRSENDVWLKDFVARFQKCKQQIKDLKQTGIQKVLESLKILNTATQKDTKETEKISQALDM
jgi:hypothetical protein